MCVGAAVVQWLRDGLHAIRANSEVQQLAQSVPDYLAGLSCGLYANTEEIAHLWRAERRFLPTLPRERAEELMAHWEHAVRQTTLAP